MLLHHGGETNFPAKYKEDCMNKFLWFLGGCATGLLAAAAISVLDESCGSSSSCEDDEDVEFADEDAPDEEAPIYPKKHFTGVSVIVDKTFPHGGCDSDNNSSNEQTEHDIPDCPDPQTT